MKIPFTNIQFGVRAMENVRSISSAAWETIGSSSTKTGVTITKENSITLSGVYNAVQVYADSISSLPISIINESNGARVKDKDHPVYPLLAREPNALMTSFVYRQIIIPEILLWGNSYSIIEFQKGTQRPISLLPVHPSKVEVEIKDGLLWYTFNLEKGKLILDQSNVLHFRGMGDNVMGKSVIDCARENLGLGKASEEFGSRFFGNGASMTGILESDKSLSDKAYTNLSNSFNNTNGGIANAMKPLILEEGLSWKPVSIPPDSAQFLETRRFSIEDIARWFNLPPHKLKDLTRATFSNIEEQDLNFVKESILPKVINIEQELNRKLLRENEKGSTFFHFNLDGLLRGDIKTRTEAYKNLMMVGAISPNEIRAKEEMNSYEGGDSKFMQLNAAPINKEGTNQIIKEDEKGEN